MGTPFLQKWLTKLLGFDFRVEYKKGVDNKVADAMSRREGWETVAALSSISLLVADWVENLKLQYHQDPELVKLIKQWYSNELDHQKYSLRQGL